MGVDDSYTKALLHMDGANDSSTITDESGLTWTNSGTLLKTAVKKFGTASAYFGGSSYLARFADSVLVFGTGDFTIDMWVYNTTSGSIRPFFDNRTSADARPLWLGRAADGTLRSYDGSTLRTGTAIPQDEWVHIAWARSGSSNKIFVNGNTAHSFSNGNDYGTLQLSGIGMDRDNVGYIGYIDEFRISIGIARWTADFTPPDAPYGPPAPTDQTIVSGATLLTELSPASAGKASGALLLSEIQPASFGKISGVMLLVEITDSPNPFGIIATTLASRTTAATLRTKRKTYATLNERSTTLTLEERP